MSLFTWEAVDAKGRRKRGELESDSERTARKTLKEQGLIVRHLNAVQEQKKDPECR